MRYDANRFYVLSLVRIAIKIILLQTKSCRTGEPCVLYRLSLQCYNVILQVSHWLVVREESFINSFVHRSSKTHIKSE